jgi:hypothetical protein
MDSRLEKIRKFEGNVMDFDSYIKDRIEQTKKDNKKQKKVNEAIEPLDWNEIEISKFINDTMSSNGRECSITDNAIIGTEIGDLQYSVSPDKKTLHLVFADAADAAQLAQFNDYKFVDREYDITSEDNIAYVKLINIRQI